MFPGISYCKSSYSNRARGMGEKRGGRAQSASEDDVIFGRSAKAIPLLQEFIQFVALSADLLEGRSLSFQQFPEKLRRRRATGGAVPRGDPDPSVGRKTVCQQSRPVVHPLRFWCKPCDVERKFAEDSVERASLHNGFEGANIAEDGVKALTVADSEDGRIIVHAGHRSAPSASQFAEIPLAWTEIKDVPVLDVCRREEIFEDTTDGLATP